MSEWLRAHPMVVLLLPMIAGILVCYYTGRPIDLLYATDVDYTDTAHTFEVVIQDYPVSKKKTVRYTGQVLARIDSAHITPARGKAYFYLQPDSTRTMPTYGDTLLVRTHIRHGGMLGEFDYGRYLRLQGIVGQGYVRHSQWRTIGQLPEPPRYVPAYWRQRLIERYRAAGIDGDELGILAAMTLGYREDMSKDVAHSFQKAGAAHILAVSGLHTGILYSVLLLLLTLGGRLKPLYDQRTLRIVQSSVVIVAMWGYALLTGMMPSVVRSVVMVSIIELGRMTYRQATPLNSIAAAALLILAVRPTDLFSVSFQLSFAAVTAIVVLEPAFSRLFPVHRIPSAWLRRIVGYVTGLLCVSIAAQVGTLPLTLYYFGQASNYFMLTNLIVIPLAWLIVVSAILLLLTFPIPGIGAAAACLCRGLVWLLHHSVAWIEALPGAVTTMRISLPMVGLLYAAILSGYFGLRRSLWWLIATAASLVLFCYLYTTI